MPKTEYELLIKPGVIDFAPSTLIEEVMQNIITLLSTAKFSVPMDRDLGIGAEFLDYPVNDVRAKLSGEIVNAVKKYEPRARVTHIDYTSDDEGHVFPRIKFRLVEAAG